MPFTFVFRFAATLAVLAFTSAAAQAQHQHAVTSSVNQLPTRVTHARPSAPLNSAFDRYRRFEADLPLIDWRKANNTVKEIGGWQTYARQSAAEIARLKIGAETAATTGVEHKGAPK
jgi:hypothetical protein